MNMKEVDKRTQVRHQECLNHYLYGINTLHKDIHSMGKEKIP